MKRRIINWSTLFVALIILAASILYTRQLIAEQGSNRRPPKTVEAQLPNVAVLSVTGATYNARINGYGETKTHYSLTLTAQTSGQVTELSKHLESGWQVKKGDVLIELEDSDYQSTVADARSELAAARLSFLEEQREASQAQAEWHASGLDGEPDSGLVLHEPQLEAAKAAVAKAEAVLVSAEKNLSRTKIIAPFDAIVVERLTAPGSYLQVGTAVATLYSTDMIEVAVPLSTRDWKNLPDSTTLIGSSWSVELKAVEDNQTWNGKVLRATRHVDSTSRQRTLIVAVDSPLDQVPPLLPGTFVGVGMNGRAVDNVMKLPNSALSQRGEIWYVEEGNILARFSAEPIFSYDGSIYINVPKKLASGSVKIVVHPLSSYLPGMKVQPVVENENA